MNLKELGWNDFFAESFKSHDGAGLIPARIISRQANLFMAFSEIGELKGKMTGRLRHECANGTDYPAVGDWVAVNGNAETGHMQINAVLPRRSQLLRANYNDGEYLGDQVISANVDVLFITFGLDSEFNGNTLLRYLAQAKSSGAKIVVVLNKSDLCENLETVHASAVEIAKDVPVLRVSASTGRGIEDIRKFLDYGITGSVIGPSGVGKSTIINALLGEDTLKTGDVRGGDYKGRHTTTWRELVMIPGGGMLIDNPGMRSFGITGDDTVVAAEFGDIEALVNQCKFGNCQHLTEPGCAIKKAIADGSLSRERFDSYLKFLREIRIIGVAKSRRSRVRQENTTASRRRKRLEDKGQ
jgi:ribosome biogenesis GTPase